MAGLPKGLNVSAAKGRVQVNVFIYLSPYNIESTLLSFLSISLQRPLSKGTQTNNRSHRVCVSIRL